MFCEQCGNKCNDDAKFCSACGTALVGTTKTAAPIADAAHTQINPPTPQNALEEKIFFNAGGVFVSDAVFKTGMGTSYPIRNISSVSVDIKESILLLLCAAVVTLFGFFIMIGSFVAGMIFLALAGALWWLYMQRPHLLKIGSGGVLQTAIESSDEPYLNNIAKAINDAILYIQRGK
jgi:hypothetical protein